MAGIRKTDNISHSRLLELLDYDPQTGIFRWKIDRTRGAKAGDVAGSPIHGYWRVTISGVLYLAHRLAWFYMTGEWPERLVDHKDRNKGNNAWGNLRLATVAQNKLNCQYANTTGHQGVSVRKNLAKPYRAAIEIEGRYKHLGYFTTAQEAGAAYRSEAQRVHGEFAP